MKILIKELAIFFPVFILNYFGYIFDCYNTILLYMVVRIWMESVLGDLDE